LGSSCCTGIARRIVKYRTASIVTYSIFGKAMAGSTTLSYPAISGLSAVLILDEIQG
jgi:hypothetical protein